MKTIIIFQGGGALGAFSAGVWGALAPRLREAGAWLAGVAGASIGGILAGVIARATARGEADWGAAALERLWRERLATPSLPFVPATAPFTPGIAHADPEAWNGLLTGLLAGTRSLYRAAPERLNPWAGMQRIDWPLFDRAAMYRTLTELIGEYDTRDAPARPWLAVGAVDVLDGELRVFDSDRAPVTPRHLAACAALPLLFDPVELDGRLYWDGEMCSTSLVPPVMDRAREAGRVRRDEDVLLVTVEPISPKAAVLPRTSVEIGHRAIELLLMRKLSRADARALGASRHLSITREPLPQDLVSGHFDYSPSRIDTLLRQGREAGEHAWEAAMAS